MHEHSGSPATGATLGAPNQTFGARDDARIPADLGFSSLGLWMSYGGGLFTGVWLCGSLGVLVATTARTATAAVLVLGLTGAVRSIWSVFAGGRLSRGEPTGGRAARGYAVGALVQSGIATVAALIFMPAPLAMPLGLTFFLALSAWPVCVLALLSRGEAKRLHAEAEASFSAIRPRNLGVEGAGAMMLLLGSIGSLMATGVLYYMVKAFATKPPIWLVGLGSLTALSMLVRAVLHVRAGVIAFSVGAQPNGSPSVRVARFDDGVRSYVMASFVSVGLAMILAMISAAAFAPYLFLPLALFAGPLVGWPLALGRFSARVRMSVVEADAAEEQSFAPSEDSGLTSLGFLLLGFSVLTAGVMLGGGLADPRSLGLSSALGVSLVPTWVKISALAVSFAAGLGMSLMTRWGRVAAITYGLVGLGAALWNAYGLLGLADGVRFRADGTFGALVGGCAVLLVVPVITLALVIRNRAQTG